MPDQEALPGGGEPADQGYELPRQVVTPRHVSVTKLVFRSFDQAIQAPQLHVAKEDPVNLVRDPRGRQLSVFLPDVSVLRGAIRDFEDRIPGARDIALVVEVSHTT